MHIWKNGTGIRKKPQPLVRPHPLSKHERLLVCCRCPQRGRAGIEGSEDIREAIPPPNLLGVKSSKFVGPEQQVRLELWRFERER
jgi:hypothetical protein